MILVSLWLTSTVFLFGPSANINISCPTSCFDIGGNREEIKLQVHCSAIVTCSRKRHQAIQPTENWYLFYGLNLPLKMHQTGPLFFSWILHDYEKQGGCLNIETMFFYHHYNLPPFPLLVMPLLRGHFLPLITAPILPAICWGNPLHGNAFFDS